MAKKSFWKDVVKPQAAYSNEGGVIVNGWLPFHIKLRNYILSWLAGNSAIMINFHVDGTVMVQAGQSYSYIDTCYFKQSQQIPLPQIPNVSTLVN